MPRGRWLNRPLKVVRESESAYLLAQGSKQVWLPKLKLSSKSVFPLQQNANTADLARNLGRGPAELKRPKLPKRLPDAISLPDVAKLLDTAYRDESPARGLRNWCTIAFLYGTGLRISEMLNLTFDKIEYQDGQPVAVLKCVC